MLVGSPARAGDSKRAESDEAVERAADQTRQFSAAHILIAYKGGQRAASHVTRTKREARALAQKVATLARKVPADFAKLARRYSDGPTGPRGGDLGVFRVGMMVKPFERAVRMMRVGAIAGPVETVFGFHVILRKALPPMLAGSHILIAYKGALRARPNVTRSKKEALALAKRLLSKLRKAQKTFAALARQYSDGPSAAKGGALGKWQKGRMVPAFDAGMQKLAIGAVGGPIETPFGYHLLWRQDPNKLP